MSGNTFNMTRRDDDNKLFCLATHSSVLVYGYLKEGATIFLMGFYIYMQLHLEEDINLTLLILSVITVDLLAITVFVISYQKINLWCIEWYYVSSLCIMVLKTCYVVVFIFISRGIMIVPLGTFMLLDILIVFVARNEIKALKAGPQVRYEFVNKLADREPLVRIVIPKTANELYLHNDAPFQRPANPEPNTQLVGHKCIYFNGMRSPQCTYAEENYTMNSIQNGAIPTVTYP